MYFCVWVKLWFINMRLCLFYNETWLVSRSFGFLFLFIRLHLLKLRTKEKELQIFCFYFVCFKIVFEYFNVKICIFFVFHHLGIRLTANLFLDFKFSFKDSLSSKIISLHGHIIWLVLKCFLYKFSVFAEYFCDIPDETPAQQKVQTSPSAGVTVKLSSCLSHCCF